MSNDPDPPGAKKLVNTESVYRLRVGDYGLIYRVDREKLVVEVILVGHRREVYR